MQKVEGQTDMGGANRVPRPEDLEGYGVGGCESDLSFKTSDNPASLPDMPVGIRQNMPSSGDTYTSIPGDGVVPG